MKAVVILLPDNMFYTNSFLTILAPREETDFPPHWSLVKAVKRATGVLLHNAPHASVRTLHVNNARRRGGGIVGRGYRG